jgi:ABC-2 type transport system ATP-binding protein
MSVVDKTVGADNNFRPEAGPIVVSAKWISKRFVVRKDNSIKERFVTAGRRGRQYREDFMALQGVNLEIEAGTTIGLIGHNGSGKSTLLKLLGGIIEPTGGEIWRRGRLAALLELGAGFHPDLSGRENVFLNASILGLSHEETVDRFDDIVEFSGISDFIDTQVKFYSSGMYVRLAFAVAVHTDPDILLVDEVLSVGDEAFQIKCLEKIRSFQAEGRTIILVTHNLGQVLDLCDRAVLLNRGSMVFDGSPREAISVFRDFLEGRRSDSTFEGRHEEIGAVSEVLAVVTDSESEPLSNNLEVTTDIWYNQRIDDWELVVQVDTPYGQAVYVSSSGKRGILSPLQGERRIKTVIRDIKLGPGDYFVSVFVLDGVGRHVIDAVHSASFEIEGENRGGGVLRADSTFEDAD